MRRHMRRRCQTEDCRPLLLLVLGLYDRSVNWKNGLWGDCHQGLLPLMHDPRAKTKCTLGLVESSICWIKCRVRHYFSIIQYHVRRSRRLYRGDAYNIGEVFFGLYLWLPPALSMIYRLLLYNSLWLSLFFPLRQKSHWSEGYWYSFDFAGWIMDLLGVVGSLVENVPHSAQQDHCKSEPDL